MDKPSKIINVNSAKDLRKFNMSLLNVETFVKVNELKAIKNPIFFAKPGVPTSDGLLSNEIFGITKEERSGIYAYIDLGEYFMNPIVYKMWSRLDSNVRDCVHGLKTYKINDQGLFEEDPDGDNGIEFIRKNFDKIEIKDTGSRKRTLKTYFIKSNKADIFVKKCPVIPAFYRDVDTNRGKTNVGAINELYRNLMVGVSALKETADYGLYMSNATRGRVQEILLQIYNWFTKEPNLSKKDGIISRAGMSKTTDYASRIVISAPELKVERYQDLMVTLDYSAVPLESVCSNFFPFMIFTVRRFFENEFTVNTEYTYIDKNGNKMLTRVKDPMIQFSDERIKEEMERYIKGFANRLIPIYIDTEDGVKIRLKFKGTRYDIEKDFEDPTGIVARPLTWCDIFYMAACEVVQNKTILITRYPYDSYFSQFPTKIRVSCMKKIECLIIDGQIYQFYPRIREEDIGKNTSNMFISTLNFSNTYLKAIVGDYDGDQVTVKGLFCDESNEEQLRLINSKSHYLGTNGINVRITTNEGIQALYNLTKHLSGTTLTSPKFKSNPIFKI